MTDSPQLWFHRLASHYVEAQVLHALNQAGVIEAIAHHGPITVSALAELCAVRPHVLDILLTFVDGVDALFERDGQGRFALSPFGRQVVARFSRPSDAGGGLNLFDVRVGAFGPVWDALPGLLSGQMVYGRDVRRAGESAARAVYIIGARMQPAIDRVLGQIDAEVVVELGVTTGLLEHVGLTRPGTALIGLDRSATSIEIARERADASGVTDIEWLLDDLFDPAGWLDRLKQHDTGLIFTFHAHEFLASDPDAFERSIAALATALPGWHVLAFEHPRLPAEARASKPESLWLFQHAHLLIHHLVGNGRILGREAWIELFGKAGARFVSDDDTGFLDHRAFLFRL